MEILQKCENSTLIFPFCPGREKWAWLFCWLLTVVTFITYWPALHANFVSWDDYPLVRDNAALNPPSWHMALKRFEHPYLQLYTPGTNLLLQGLAFAERTGATGKAEPLDPMAFHLGLILLHLSAIPLVFMLLRILVNDEIAAALGAGVVALHPLGVEATAWVSSIGIAASMPLIAATLWQWIKFRRAARSGSNRPALHYALATSFYMLALLIKPSNVTIPIMVWILDATIEKIDWRKSITAIAPWLLAAISMIVITTRAQPASAFAFSQPAIWQRPAVALDGIFFYLQKFSWPVGLTIDYGRTPRAVLHHPGLLSIESVLLCILVAALYRSRQRVIIAGAAIVVAALLPVLGLTSFAFQLYSTVADRYAYPALLGAAIIFAYVLSRMKNVPVRIAMCVLLCIWGCMTFQQVRTWKDNYSLFTRVLRINSQSWMAWNSLGNAMILDGRVTEGLEMSRTAWKIAPARPSIAINIGTALAMLHRSREALPYLQFAALHEPEDFVVAANLSHVYSELQDPEAAALWQKRALQRRETNALHR